MGGVGNLILFGILTGTVHTLAVTVGFGGVTGRLLGGDGPNTRGVDKVLPDKE